MTLSFVLPLFISMPGPIELVLICLVIILLFGAKRIPEIARSIGEAFREFRKSLSGNSDKQKKGKKQ